MKNITIITLTAILLFIISCNNSQTTTTHKTSSPADTTLLSNDSVYKSPTLIITKISNHVYEHTSFLDTHDFGKVPCNGMIVVDSNEAIIFDTPTDDKGSEELISFLNQKMHTNIIAIIATHFHADCVGGLETFHQHSIPSYANSRTIDILKGKKDTVIPKNGFDKELKLKVGNNDVYAEYFGEGHTKDNIIGYFPAEKVMFGGCLIKELGAKKGNLEDANTKDWSKTVFAVKEKYPDVNIIIPGHGLIGDSALLNYTIDLFK